MRSNSNILLLGLAAFALYYHFRNDASEARLFSSVRLQMKDISVSGGAIVIKFNVQNPTSDRIRFNSLVGDVYLNGQKVGNAESFAQTWLGTGNTEITVKVQMKAYNLTNELVSMIQGRNGAVLAFNGTINLNDKIVPVATNFRLA